MPLEPPVARAADRRRPLTRVLLSLLLLGACSGGASTPSDAVDFDVTAAVPASEAGASSAAGSPAPSDGRDGVVPEGFSTATVRITSSNGEVCEVCVWLADTADERGRGLMGVTDLGGAAGMLFVFGEAVTTSFYMLDTPEPLSIAWFGDAGELVGTADMEPCLDVPAPDCPRYAPDDAEGAPVPYTMALETWQGGLASLDIADGSRLELLGGADVASGCPIG